MRRDKKTKKKQTAVVVVVYVEQFTNHNIDLIKNLSALHSRTHSSGRTQTSAPPSERFSTSFNLSIPCFSQELLFSFSDFPSNASAAPNLGGKDEFEWRRSFNRQQQKQGRCTVATPSVSAASGTVFMGVLLLNTKWYCKMASTCQNEMFLTTAFFLSLFLTTAFFLSLFLTTAFLFSLFLTTAFLLNCWV